jgi:poly(3-hydroxyalkanoate) synthetase
VPWRVVLALDNAVANMITHRTDEGHEGEVVERKTRRVSYQFINKPTDEEIKAWHERTDAEFCA